MVATTVDEQPSQPGVAGMSAGQRNAWLRDCYARRSLRRRRQRRAVRMAVIATGTTSVLLVTRPFHHRRTTAPGRGPTGSTV